MTSLPIIEKSPVNTFQLGAIVGGFRTSCIGTRIGQWAQALDEFLP